MSAARWVVAAAVAVGALVLGPRGAAAYPQFIFDGAQTCVDCHVAPAGGGQLNEYGLMFAEDLSRGDGNEAFLHGTWTPPSWLSLSGDVRIAGGIAGRGDYGPAVRPSVVPMQVEANAVVRLARPLTFHATAGARGFAEEEPLNSLSVREHYVMLRAAPDDGHGAYARIGRFMAPYGLRLAEHPAYTRRYAGTNLFAETYGASIGWISGFNELHVTGFMADRWLDEGVEPGDGGALYAEHRFGDRAAIGLSARYADARVEARAQLGMTGKLRLPGAALLQLQVDGIHQTLSAEDGTPYPARDQLVAYLLASRRSGPWMMALGLGHYDENLDIKDLDRDAIDFNLHWFVAAHMELALTTRAQTIGLGKGGPTSGYALLQFHYRL
jgi:hypothetical protein